ncbi:helix-turn-helix transcriptional regulator [Stenomitos frigidus]|uniref:Helix-turn-helix transcriptional regulator n=1 Tax=Stenomitos frigidus ULC18 TaxID=2107698 RepID=A0A2T1DVR2_9CYAN|nr:LuxR C-terminal-related transcriptional regulator [Stenomitos frigidus]PSB24521.1 helix-turn-helix transcriptional regulator [Stenomitos frigidus ULC18]
MHTVTSTLKQPSLLQALLEGFIDGVLILTDQGEWIHANDRARRICNQLTQGLAQPDRVPQEIWRTCQGLIGSLKRYPQTAVTFEDEIITGKTVSYRIRAQWLNLELWQHPCLLITLEDQVQSIQSTAIAEGQQYQLTPRELDVWLRYRASYTYKEIATELYITHNTVKKHMKNIFAKRQMAIAIAD